MNAQRKQVLIYAGTTEGRLLAETLAKAGIRNTVCVATEYGEEVMPRLAGIRVEVGRKNIREMVKLTEEGDYCAIVDATHPFALEVSENIRESGKQVGLPYLRLQREVGIDGMNTFEKVRRFSDADACAEALKATQGRILLTTGSKELAVFCQDEAVRQRLVVRILPGEENIRICKELGIVGKQIIAMQGPFSQKMNEAILCQYKIRYLVTKESGRIGGVDEKLRAAEHNGVQVWMIGNPEKEPGLNFEQVIERIGGLSGGSIAFEGDEVYVGVGTEEGIVPQELLRGAEQGGSAAKENSEKKRKVISLIGVGMGNPDTLTLRAKELIDKADYLFGAERLIASFEAKLKKQPEYLPEKVLGAIEKIKTNNEITYIAILYSGDTGFASGCAKMYSKLLQEGYENVEILPGISTISYLSAKSGIPWQNAELFSIHGKGVVSEWRMELLWKVRYHSYTFLLVSGVKDIQEIGRLLLQRGVECELFIGYQMSYPEEQYYHVMLHEAVTLTKEGLYGCIVINKKPEAQLLASHVGDEEFLRDKVPMTKAEIRALSIAKLQLREHAVVYDIGSGTGSIAVEIAQHSPTVKVYAIEQKPEAVQLICKNVERFGVDNVEVVEGMAPEILRELPSPTHVFIGGSKGKLRKIINLIEDTKNTVRVVMNGVSLETIKEITDIVQEYEEAEIIQVVVSRAKKLGDYHMMQAQNPVMICSLVLNLKNK